MSIKPWWLNKPGPPRCARSTILIISPSHLPKKTEATSNPSILNKSDVVSCLIALWLCFYGLWLCLSYWRINSRQIWCGRSSIPISASNQKPPQCLYSVITTLLRTLHDFYSTSLRYSMLTLVGAHINRAMPSFRGFRFVLVRAVSDGTK